MLLRADGFPRRSDLSLLLPEEKQLYDLMRTIDHMKGDTTEIVMLLNEARSKLADYVEKSMHSSILINKPNQP